MLFNINIFFILVSAIAGIAVYFQRPTGLYLKLFPLLIFLAAVVEVTGWWLMTRGHNTYMLYNFFSTSEFVFYLWFLSNVIQSKKVRRIIFNLLWLYPLSVILNVLFVQTKSFHTITYSIGSLLIVSICIYYFFELFRTTTSVKLVREPAFWICSGLLFFYCCSYPFFAMVNFWRNPSIRIMEDMIIVISIMNIFLYSSFAIGFLCRIKTRSSTY